MLAYRRIWHIKLGHMDEARELIQKAVDAFKERNAIGRVYSSHIGPMDIIVWEENWETEAEHNEFWDKLRKEPELKSWGQSWRQVIERGGAHEVWHLTT